jgi:phage terminase large subunit-like protein
MYCSHKPFSKLLATSTLDDGQTAGMIWYTETPREDLDARYTFGIRMYERTRGKKFVEGFM